MVRTSCGMFGNRPEPASAVPSSSGRSQCPALAPSHRWGRTLLSMTGTLRPGKGPQMEACASEKGPEQLLAAGQMPAGRQLCPRLSRAYTLRPSWRGSQASFQICGKPHAAHVDDGSSHVHTGKSEKARGSDAATHTLYSVQGKVKAPKGRVPPVLQGSQVLGPGPRGAQVTAGNQRTSPGPWAPGGSWSTSPSPSGVRCHSSPLASGHVAG